ncbi:hypothetical protein D3C71_1986770 [compost metagenome]
MFVNLQSVVVNEAGIALNFVCGRDAIDPFQYKTDEAIAFAFDASHHFTAIDGGFSRRVDAKARSPFDLMHRFCRSDQ